MRVPISPRTRVLRFLSTVNWYAVLAKSARNNSCPIQAYKYVYVYVFIYVCLYTCMYVCMYLKKTCVALFVYSDLICCIGKIRKKQFQPDKSMQVCKYVSMQVYVCVYMRMCVYTWGCVCYMFVCTNTWWVKCVCKVINCVFRKFDTPCCESMQRTLSDGIISRFKSFHMCEYIFHVKEEWTKKRNNNNNNVPRAHCTMLLWNFSWLPELVASAPHHACRNGVDSFLAEALLLVWMASHDTLNPADRHRETHIILFAWFFLQVLVSRCILASCSRCCILLAHRHCSCATLACCHASFLLIRSCSRWLGSLGARFTCIRSFVCYLWMWSCAWWVKFLPEAFTIFCVVNFCLSLYFSLVFIKKEHMACMQYRERDACFA